MTLAAGISFSRAGERCTKLTHRSRYKRVSVKRLREKEKKQLRRGKYMFYFFLRNPVGACGIILMILMILDSANPGQYHDGVSKYGSNWLVAWGLCGSMLIRFSTVWLLPFSLL